MSKKNESKKKVKSAINAIKTISSDKIKNVGKTYDNFLDNTSNLDNTIAKKVDGFLGQTSSKINNKTSFFEDIVDIANSFINNVGNDNQDGTNRLKNHAEKAIKLAIKDAKSIVLNNVQKSLFAGDGICGGNTLIPEDEMTIRPNEFDFLNVLTIDPSSSMGKIVYEPNTVSTKTKFNYDLYDTFSNDYDFTSVGGKNLFSLNWDVVNQQYNVTGLKQNLTDINVGDFLNDYYSSIDITNFDHVIKTAVSLTVQGDGSETKLFNVGLNNAERLMNRLFSLCPSGGSGLFESNPTTSFNETEDEIEMFYDFDRVDDINMENEDSRLRRVLKFKDCDNFEIPVEPSLIGDFSYLAQTTNKIEELVDLTLERSSAIASENSGGRFNLSDFSISIKNLYILNLPKALIYSILSPKIFFPIILIYKQLRSSIIQLTDTVKDYMRALGKLFNNIILEFFWKFIKEFWGLIKPDLVKFIANLAKQIIKEKYRKYVIIVSSLLSFLTELLTNPNLCENVFGLVEKTINTALNGGISTNIPNLLLAMTKFRGGFSQERATVEIVQYMESLGIDTGDIYGEPNEIISFAKSLVGGIEAENLKNGVYQGVNDGFYIGSLYFPPGIIKTNSIKT